MTSSIEIIYFFSTEHNTAAVTTTCDPQIFFPFLQGTQLDCNFLPPHSYMGLLIMFWPMECGLHYESKWDTVCKSPLF